MLIGNQVALPLCSQDGPTHIINPNFSRRTALFGGALALGSPFLNPRVAICQETGTSNVVLPTFYDRMVGDLRVTALLDGFFDLGRPLITNATAEQIDAGMAKAYLGAGEQIRLPDPPGFTGGQNSRRIARYGTESKEELKAVFA